MGNCGGKAQQDDNAPKGRRVTRSGTVSHCGPYSSVQRMSSPLFNVQLPFFNAFGILPLINDAQSFLGLPRLSRFVERRRRVGSNLLNTTATIFDSSP